MQIAAAEPRSARVTVRRSLSDDVEAIRAIYNDAVATTTATMDFEPRSPEKQAAWMAVHSVDHYPVFVAEEEVDGEGGTVLGYASLSPYNPKPGYAPSAEVSVYVRSDRRGRGVGRALVEVLLETAHRNGQTSLVASITADNYPSIHLHAALGFETVGTLRRAARKFDAWVDVTLMQRLLDEDGAETDTVGNTP